MIKEILGILVGIGLLSAGFWVPGAIIIGVTLAVQDRRLGLH